MVATTWVVPSAVFFPTIIGWQYFVGGRSVPDGKCFVQYMDSAVFNCLLQVGYFWATLIIMCALYTGIYRVALRLHRESAARRRTMAVVTAQTGSHPGPASSAATSSTLRVVAPVTVSAANNDHAHQSIDSSPDLSLSEQDATVSRNNDTNDVTLLLPVPAGATSSTQADTSSSGRTFTVDDDDIRFADDVTDDDDEVFDRQLMHTSGNDVNLRNHQQQQQQSDQVSSRDHESGRLLPPSSQERDTYRHSVEWHELVCIDTVGVPTRRRFCGHRLLSSRRRQRRSRSDWPASGQVIDELSA